MVRPKRRHCGGLLCAVLLIAPIASYLSAQTPVTTTGEAEKEVVLGAELAKHIEQKDGRLQNAGIAGYVQHLETKLAISIPSSPLDIHLTNSREEYAILLPRRVLYFSSGLLLRTQSEAELAAILAHEQAHSPAMHFMHASQAQFILVSFGNCVLSSPLAPWSWASHIRQSEIQANTVGVQYLRSAHYDPISLFAILSKLAYEHEGWNKALVSDDLEAARGALESEPLPPQGYIEDSSAFAAMHDQIERIANVPRQSNITLFRH